MTHQEFTDQLEHIRKHHAAKCTEILGVFQGPRFDAWGNRINEDGSLWSLDGKLAARNGNE